MRIALRFSIGFVATSLLALAGAALAQSGRYYDPPSRVARLAHAEGSVSFSPAGTSDWRRAHRNRPHTRGDRLWTDRRSRAELQLGGAAIRLDERTGIEILELDDRNTQIELSEGTLNLSVRHIERGQVYEIATPMFALVVDRRANVRIDVEPRSGRTEVVVWDGTATAYAERGRFALHEGDAVRFFDETLRDYDFFDARPDGFDSYVDARDARLDRSGSLRYVPAGLIGYDDLDEYGSWRATPDYGSVWFPSRVGANWRPYRDGHWIHQEPWGWTWVDDAEWGFATSHYGRWAQVDRRWGWIPSPRRERPVYAPALVGFVGSFGAGSRQPIGWFPLGPREVYMPSYRTSRDYFTRVNYGNTTFQDRSWIDGAYRAYDGGRGYATDYRYRNQNDIVSVPRDVFVNARPVSRAAVAYRGDTSAAAQLDRIRDLAPVSASRYGAGATATSAPQGEVFQREVFARHAPAAGAPVDSGARGRERGLGRDNVRMIRGEGLPVIARDAPRTEGSAAELDRGIDRGADRASDRAMDRRADPGERGEGRAAERALERRADPGERGEGRAAERALERRADPDADRGDPRDARDDQRDVEQARREAERAQREGARAQDERQRERDHQAREHEQAQREAERIQREQERAQQQAEQQAREQQRAQQEAERQLREQQHAQRQAEQQAQQEAERAAREQQRAQQQAQREAEQQARQLQQAQEQAQRDAEQQLREQQQAQEQAQREAERAAREQQQAQEQAQREAERAAREQQQAQEQAQREAERVAREQQQAQEQAQREAERQAREAQGQPQGEGEDEREGRRRKKDELDRDDGGTP
ncbi:MAG TPA: DUF6600 domain-containing protein [Candidatus Saccharimonadia bacterium]|nr:DUF6600 domain-containing protein [Candidatus Saccharimonadia bacterium]